MCHMCHTQELYLFKNQIGDAGATALANACAGGALAQLEVSSRLTALDSCLKTWHARSPGLTVLFDVPYVPYADAGSPLQPDWRSGCNGFGRGLRRRGNGTVDGELAPHCLGPMPWDLACVFSPVLTVSFDVPYVPYAGALSLQKSDW